MKHVFITGMGRSGTKFLAGLLRLDPNFEVHHEAIGNREYWLLSWYLGESFQLPYLNNEKKRIHKNDNDSALVDVNSYLQNSSKSLKEVFKDCHIFHLVRDPRKVVPSIYTRRDDTKVHKLPKEPEEVVKWLQMNKLQQVCYNWTQTTNQLIDEEIELLKFEEITTNYDYLKTQLLDPIGANISYKQFESFRKIKVNQTKSRLYRFLYAKYKGKPFIDKQSNFENFSREQKEMFFDICGTTMKKLNYDK